MLAKITSFLALTALLLVFLSFFTPPGAAAGNGAVLRVARRSAVENGENLVLAEERTRRKDPLNCWETRGLMTVKLRLYDIGNNNKDKGTQRFTWKTPKQIGVKTTGKSVLYTGGPLFDIAAFWFVLFGIFLLLACMYACCCRRRRYGYSRVAYALSLIFLTLFTIAAVIGAIVLYTGQGKFHDSTKHTFEYVLEQADSTVDNLRSFSSYLTSAKKVGVDQVFLPQDVQNNIDKVNTMITSAADALESATKNNKNDIFNALDTVGLILIIVAAVMLALAFLGFLLSISGLQFLVYILVVVGWILVALTFIFCGIFLVLHNVVGDTCVAMNDWVTNPTAHTALDKIIPCVDVATAQEAQSQSKEVTFQMAQLVNGIIANISNRNPPPAPVPLPISYNQSGPLVPLLCNPYNPDKTDRKTCNTDEVVFENATQVWKNYECRVSNNTCITVGRLTPSMYDQMTVAVNVSYGLYHYGPFLTNLVDCTFVRDTFTAIHKDHCPDLKLYSKWVYIGLVMVSAAVMLSLIFWVVYARERRHRKYTKQEDAAAAAAQVPIEGKGP